MNLSIEQQVVLQRMLGRPKVTFARFGIHCCSQRKPELDAMVEAGALERKESIEPWGPTVTYIVTPAARAQVARMAVNAGSVTP